MENIKIAIISDIHGNKEAFFRVLLVLKKEMIDGIICLGDLIDYGMHSNEIIRMMQEIKLPILCNIWGNHEQAIITDSYDRFSSERGRQCARYTRTILDENGWNYITRNMWDAGMAELNVGGKKCLAIHGSLNDMYWKAIKPEQDLKDYLQYDYVFSGHSHLPHYFEVFYPFNNPKTRNKKKTIFINPGSVGQPRNLNPMAQFCILNTATEEVSMLKVPYNICKEQSAYDGQVDVFYKERLATGV